MDYRKPFLPQITREIIKEAYDYVHTPFKIPSISIRSSLSKQYIAGETWGYLNVPFYWAHWYHDGRGRVNAKPGGFLIWYKNPDDDPRLSGGYPIRPSDVKRLSRERFKQDRAAGKLIVARSSGPTTKNYPFFSDSAGGGMQGFQGEVNVLVEIHADEYVRDVLRSKDLFKKKVTVRI
tara:strand:- start:1131 stop:1664 length:534 start_codon:yes stop_codon:yes gene_type:complete